MSRKSKPDTATGVIIINKHEGVTSHRIVQILRRLFDTPRVGHTGTLDPMATGVLPVLIGRAVKASDYLMSEEKEYIARLRLGLTTDTFDTTGTVLSQTDKIPSEAEVIRVCESFIGEQEQLPPMYSAVKIGGEKLVDLARRGETVERTPRKIEIKSLKAKKITEDSYELSVVCTKGTYIRTLCSDIGEALGCGGAMSALVRTRSGGFTLEGAHTVEELEQMSFEERLQLPLSVESLFSDLPRIDVNDFYEKLFRGGTELYQKKLGTCYDGGQLVRVYHKGEFFALGRATDFAGGSAIKPEKLFKL